MDKKNLVLISKCCLLLAFIGFCVPIFNSNNGLGNGFAPIFSLLPDGPDHLAKAKDKLAKFEAENESLANVLAEKKVLLNDEFAEIKAEYKAALKDDEVTLTKKALRKQKNNKLRKAWSDYKEEYSEYGKPHDKLVAAKKAAQKEIFIPIALIIFICSLVLSIVFTALHYVVLKKSEYKRVHCVIDVLLYILILASSFFAFTGITKIDTDVLSGVTYSVGYYVLVVGLILSVIIYLFSTTLDEDISSKQEERRAYWMLALPAIFFYFAVMTFPAIFSVVLSFTDYSGGVLFEKFSMFFIGWDNYVDVFKDSIFYISLKNNFYVVLVSVFGQLPLGFLLAYVLNRGLVKGRDFYQTMIYLPCVISTVVIGILFQAFFSASGAWTDLMKLFNPDYKWSMNGRPMLPVLFVILWMYTGTYLIVFLANLQKLDPGIIEAATIDGATEGQVLWHIIFPQLSGTFVISAILAISGSLKSFDLIYVMTAGGPAKQTYVLSLYMFDKAFKGAANYPMANTISTIMVVISLLLIGVVKALEKKFGAEED